jgi:hypothetical protein
MVPESYAMKFSPPLIPNRNQLTKMMTHRLARNNHATMTSILMGGRENGGATALSLCFDISIPHGLFFRRRFVYRVSGPYVQQTVHKPTTYVQPPSGGVPQSGAISDSSKRESVRSSLRRRAFCDPRPLEARWVTSI